MRPLGVVRRLDQLGRIVIPVELRKRYNIHLDDEIEIFVDGDTVVLQKHIPRCIFCQSSTEEPRVFKERVLCEACFDSIQKTAHSSP